MTCDLQDTVLSQILKPLMEHGTAELKSTLEQLLNLVMCVERQQHLKIEEPYQRGEDRQGQANGFKPKTLETRVGKLDLKVPQVRDSTFYPSCLDKGLRSERALLLSLAEMYVTGVSTRKVTNIVEKLCGFDVTSMDVSRATKLLDEEFQQWRQRPIGEVPYLFLDARYEKVRHGGSVIDVAVLIAMAITSSGHRTLLGVSVSLSEHEVHWRAFLKSLLDRGLMGVKLIISDAHVGLKAARKAVLPSVRWQRCQFHLQQNAQSYVPKQSMKSEVAGKIKRIFNAEDRADADRLHKETVKFYETSAPKLSNWLETAIPEGLEVFNFPASQRRRLRTTNPLERVNKEVKRRTRVASLFPNVESCERLVTAILMEISEEWETGKIYLSLE